MEKFDVTAPYSGRLMATLERTSAIQVEEAFKKADLLFSNRKNWLKTHEKIKILESFCQLLQKEFKALIHQACEEGGKPLADSRIEVTRAIEGVKIAIAHMYTDVGTQVPMGLSSSSDQRLAYTLREPAGLVFAISAFNHPVNLIIHQVIPAIAVGCPVIIKPASRTPLSCLKLVDLLYEAGLPKTWCQVILCNNAIAEHYVSDPRVRFFSFIGSGNVGWSLRSKLAKGALCALEHGGAAPVIIESNSRWQEGLDALVKGGFYHAGQVCVSVQRVFVQETIFDSFTASFTQAAQNLKVGDPLEESTHVGPIISETEVQRIDQWVEEARHSDANILCGGKKLEYQCYAPTVIAHPKENLKVSTEEIFGPVVCLYSYRNLEEAFQRANRLPYAFQAAIWTDNIDYAFQAIQHLEFKTVLVNDHTAFRTDWMPFGGRKHSGQGVGGIPYSMHEMSYEKMFILNLKG